MKKHCWIGIIGLLVTSLAIVGLYQARAEAKPIVWRCHTPHTEGRVNFAVEKEWCDTISKATNGRLTIEIYPGAALGFKDADILSVLKAGLLETSYLYGGYYSRDEPTFSLILAQMVFKTRDEMLALFPVAYEQYKKLFSEWGIRLGTMWPTLNCNVAAMGKEPCGTLASMKGKKIRVWEAQMSDTLKQLGISGVVIPQNDLYLALKTGVVDGCLHYPEALRTLSIYEDIKYFSLLYPVPVAQSMGFSEKALQSLPSDLRQTILRASEEHRQKWMGLKECTAEGKDIAWAEAKGVKRLPDFSGSDRNLLSETAIEVWRARAKKVGDKAVKYQQLMEKELMRARAQSK